MILRRKEKLLRRKENFYDVKFSKHSRFLKRTIKVFVLEQLFFLFLSNNFCKDVVL